MRFVSSAGLTLADWRRSTAGRHRTDPVEPGLQRFALEFRDALRALGVGAGGDVAGYFLGLHRATLKRWAAAGAAASQERPPVGAVAATVSRTKNMRLRILRRELVALRRVWAAIYPLENAAASWVLRAALAARDAGADVDGLAPTPGATGIADFLGRRDTLTAAPSLGELADQAGAHEPPGWVTDGISVEAAREVAEWLRAPEWLTPAVSPDRQVGDEGAGGEIDERPHGSSGPVSVRLDIWREGGASKPPCDLACVRGPARDAACPAVMGCVNVARAARAEVGQSPGAGGIPAEATR